MTDSPDGRFADASFAQLVFDLQMRQLERAGGTAQSLLSAATISGALAGPLLAIGLEKDAFGYALAALLGVYLGTLAVAVRTCLSIVYTRPGDLPPEKMLSVLHYRHIAAAGSPQAYAQRVLDLTDEQQISSVLSDAFVVSQVLTDKADRMRQAVLWTKLTLAVLGLLVLVKALSLVTA